MSIVVQQLTYTHSDKELLFNNICFILRSGQKVALTGNNGSGKSTLLKIISGNLRATTGEIKCSSVPYYVPQHFGQYDAHNVAQMLGIDKKIEALQAILNGNAAEEYFTTLADDWTIEQKAVAALEAWGIGHIQLSQSMTTLSGGEKTKVFLAGIKLHTPDIILLDEPTNHLDDSSRQQLYDFVKRTPATLVVVSHDRDLLNLLPTICELEKSNITHYGGNYEFYKECKEGEQEALHAKLEEQEKELRAARKTALESAERRQKQDIRGEKHNHKRGVGKMMMNILKDRAEKSSSKLNDIHGEKIGAIAGKITDLRSSLPDDKQMKVDFNTSALHSGKNLVTAQNINIGFQDRMLWDTPLNFQIKSGERLQIKGKNGTGKTTLLRLITGEIPPSEGTISLSGFKHIYLDQEYSIIKNERSIFEQIREYAANRPESEINILLNRFLFPYEIREKKCAPLSGGEKMKLALCCLMAKADTPDMFILDEPTNNIDLRNIEILTATIKDFGGTIVVVSHDSYFIRQIGINRTINLDMPSTD